MSKEETADLKALPQEMITSMESVPAGSVAAAKVSAGSDLKLLQETHEKEMIEKVLQDVRYNKSKAAKLLNIDRKTLYYKIEKYHIE